MSILDAYIPHMTRSLSRSIISKLQTYFTVGIVISAAILIMKCKARFFGTLKCTTLMEGAFCIYQTVYSFVCLSPNRELKRVVQLRRKQRRRSGRNPQDGFTHDNDRDPVRRGQLLQRHRCVRKPQQIPLAWLRYFGCHVDNFCRHRPVLWVLWPEAEDGERLLAWRKFDGDISYGNVFSVEVSEVWTVNFTVAKD